MIDAPIASMADRIHHGSPTDRLVYAALVEHGPGTPADLAAYTGLRRNRVQDALHRLRRADHVTRTRIVSPTGFDPYQYEVRDP